MEPAHGLLCCARCAAGNDRVETYVHRTQTQTGHKTAENQDEPNRSKGEGSKAHRNRDKRESNQLQGGVFFLRLKEG